MSGQKSLDHQSQLNVKHQQLENLTDKTAQFCTKKLGQIKKLSISFFMLQKKIN